MSRSLFIREKQQQECMKWLPIAGGVILVMLLIFGVWVRSVPPLVIKLEKPPIVQGGGGGGMPEFMTMDTQPVVTTKTAAENEKKGDENLQAIKDPGIETVEF
jgi:hypothetical protein